jgi:serine/threonine protein kinase
VLEAIAKKNGSEILKNVKTLMIFTKEEIYDITENNAKYLGRGCFGKVHKGTLADKTDVAVKESIEATEDTKGEFVKEVEIQSKMMHRNILKLLGCCLRVDLPLLVYEYAAKGNLQNILHGNETQQPEPLPLNSRLSIAIGCAQGLAYMHTYTESGMQHADVKPSNILLDGEFVPKISDFWVIQGV